MIDLVDVLLLEDNPRIQVGIKGMIRMENGSNVSVDMVGNCADFMAWLGEGKRARVYALDDYVPDEPNTSVTETSPRRFIINCGILYTVEPHARVLYIGSGPSDQEKAYCRDHAIPIIYRPDIGKIVKKILTAPLQ